jgi:endonuclease G, mitochondrial
MAKRKNQRRKAARKDARPERKTAKKAAQETGPTEAQLEAFLRTRGEALVQDKNITSVGTGYAIRDGKRTLCLQFTVRKRGSSPSELEALGTSPIPKHIQIGKHSVPTDVLQREFRPSYVTTEAAPKDFRKRRQPTLVPGISVSHRLGTAGTLGLIVYESATGDTCMLSNWHVLHGPEGELGDEIVQPGPFDDDRVEQNRAGVLVRSHLGLAGDCAIARIEGRESAPEIHGLKVAPHKLAKPELDDRVVKSGRTTAVTRGIVTRTNVITKIDYEGDVGVVNIGGFEYGPDPEAPPANGEVSMGGDSGSAVLVAGKDGKPKDILVGLHFAGEGRDDPNEHGVACYATNVFEKLEIALAPVAAPEDAPEAVAAGFDPDFLGPKVTLPRLSAAHRKDAFVHQGSSVLRYTHFSVVMSKARRMARLVGWNIDGDRLKAYGRKGLDFLLDKRVGKSQIGNEAYLDNKLDRGHIARRADLVWGAPAEARQANRDSFYYTNITPQHQAFNQSERHGLWGRLENAVLEQTDVQNLRVSVLAGPLFKDTDMTYRKIRVPSDFWKLVAYVDADDGALHVRAFLLTQENLLDDIEALDLDEFRLWQLSVAALEQRTGLDFGHLGESDDHDSDGPEAVGGGGGRPREVHSEAELFG